MIVEHHLVVPRTARYVTAGGDAGADALRDLWMVCHGYGQLAAPFIQPFVRLATPWRQIVAPEGLSRFYPERSRAGATTPAQVGASWMTREDREHEIADQVTYLNALHDVLRPPALAGRVRLRVLGFSQGVATVVRWLLRGSARADEVILWAGSFPPDVDVGSFARRIGEAPVVLVVGARDELAPWAAADDTLQRLLRAGVSARAATFEGGHRLDDATLDAIAASS